MSEAGDGSLKAVHERLDDLEIAVTEVLRDGLGNVRSAVTEFANTKADRSEVKQLRQEIRDLKKQGGNRLKIRRVVIVLACMVLALTMVGCDWLFPEEEEEYTYTDDDIPPYEDDDYTDGADYIDVTGLSNTCYATHVDICVEYTWEDLAAFENAKGVCEGDSRNRYRNGHECPLPSGSETRVGCFHEGSTGASITWTYFGADGRNSYVVDTEEGVRRTCRENGGTVVD